MIYIEARYQRWGQDGIVWTKWYQHKRYDSMSEAEIDLVKLNKMVKGRKMKSEFRIVEQ